MRLFWCVVLLGFAATTQAQQPSFSALAEGERAEIEYRSIGCFHTEARGFVIEGGSKTRVTLYNTDERGLWEWFIGTFHLGKLDERGVLSPDKVGKLDNLLAVYRGKEEGLCTLSETVRITWFLASGKRVEEHEDSSCSYYFKESVLGLAGVKDVLEEREKLQGGLLPLLDPFLPK